MNRSCQIEESSFKYTCPDLYLEANARLLSVVIVTQPQAAKANHVDPVGPEQGPAIPGYEPGLSLRRRRGRRSRVSFTGQAAAAQKEEAIRRTPQFVIGLGRLGTKGGKRRRRRRHWLACAARWKRREDGPREAQGQKSVSLGRCEYRRIFSQRSVSGDHNRIYLACWPCFCAFLLCM